MADATMDMVLKVRTELDRARKDIKGLTTDVNKLGKQQTKTGKMSGAFKSQIMSMVGPIAIATAAVGGLTKVIGEIAAREDALADFSAITGVTGEKLEEFGDAAVSLSNKFGTGVIDNIEAFKGVLSRFGPDFASSKDAVESMGDSINVLAKASGLDATQSMDALTTAMLQFGVDLSDPNEAASKAAEMMNVMAAAAKEGAAEIPQLNEGLKQVGTTADSLNVSFVETNAALEVLAAGGKSGSEAGVGLRNVMVSLTKATKKGEQALAGIGTSTGELGKILTQDGLQAALAKFDEKLQQLPSSYERAALKAQVFGKENLAAANVLLNGTEQMGEFSEKIDGTSTAYDQAAVKMATSSEQLKRGFNEAWNTIVSGVEDGGSLLADSFLLASTQIDKSVDAFSKLIRLDVSGFWDTLTMSVGEYNEEKETQLQLEDKNYRAMVKQLDEEERQHKSKAQLLKLQGELVKALKEVEGVTDSSVLVEHMDAFAALFNKGQIKSVDEYFLSLKAAASEAAEELDKEGQKRADTMAKLQESLERRKVSIDILHRETSAMEENAAALSYLRISIMGVITGMEERIAGVDVSPLSDAFVGTDGVLQNIDLGTSMADDFALAWDQVGVTIADVGALFQTAFSGGAEGLKSSLKMLLNIGIDFLEAEVAIAAGYASVKALLSSGLSAITDAPLAVAAYAGLEVARGFVNSFRSGIDYVPSNQMAMLHEGERVQSREEVQSERPSQRKYMNNTMHVSAFKTAIEDYYITTGTKVR